MMDKKELQRRLLRKVEIIPETFCWNGVAQIEIEGKEYSSTRLSAYAFGLFDLEPGLFVCHHCDNCFCIRPDHLFIGTPKDNSRDCTLKNRKGHYLFGDPDWPYITVLFPKSVFQLAARMTDEYGLKTIPDLVALVLDHLPSKK